MLKQARQFRHRRIASRAHEWSSFIQRIPIIKQLIPIVRVDELIPSIALGCQLVEISGVDIAAGAAFEMDDL